MSAGVKANNDGSAAIQVGGSDAIQISAALNTTFVGTASVTGNLSFNSGYGSSAVAYGCRAWINFNGTGTVAIRASGNVTSITDNNVGDYTVNFTTAMPDANYSTVLGSERARASINTGFMGAYNVASGSIRIITQNTAGAMADFEGVDVAVFR